uniref:Uncharacterized protein n=1 Tax=Romanomermis culicivorax TaxID=13658 RepID=A0A915KE47_ROMCU
MNGLAPSQPIGAIIPNNLNNKSTVFEPPPPKKSFVDAVNEAVKLRLKQRNAVLFGLPETDDDLGTVRELLAQNPSNDDQESPICPSDVQYVFRDGPKSDGRLQFLNIVCSMSKAKRSFIPGINKVVKPAGHAHLRARPDLTFQRRQDGRLLRSKLDEF